MELELALATVLTVFYIISVIIVALQLLRHIVFRHRLNSFQFGFLVLCFIWMLLRTCWFTLDFKQAPPWLLTFVVFAPSVCQIATFSLVVLFFGRQVHKKAWKELKGGFFTCYAMSVSIMVMFTALFAGLYGVNNSKGGAEETYQLLDEMYFFISGCYYAGLILVASYYIIKLRSEHQHRTTFGVAMSVAFVFMAFLSRCIVDFFSAYQTSSSNHICRDNCSEYSNQKTIDLLPFGLLIIWELIPTMLILWYFRSIPYTRLHRFIKFESYLLGWWVHPEDPETLQDSPNELKILQPYLDVLPCLVCLPCFGLPLLSNSAFAEEKLSADVADFDEPVETVFAHKNSVAVTEPVLVYIPPLPPGSEFLSPHINSDLPSFPASLPKANMATSYHSEPSFSGAMSWQALHDADLEPSLPETSNVVSGKGHRLANANLVSTPGSRVPNVIHFQAQAQTSIIGALQGNTTPVQPAHRISLLGPNITDSNQRGFRLYNIDEEEDD